MFTSRAEYRLSLREDNADLRLTEIGRNLGLVDDVRWEAFNRKRDSIATETERLRSTWVSPKTVSDHVSMDVLGQPLEHEYRLLDLLRRPQVRYAELQSLVSDQQEILGATGIDIQVIEQIEIQAKYQGYIERQQEEVAKTETQENLRLPSGFDYGIVHGLSIEVRQKLSQYQPETIGQATRIQGITPAAISLLLVHLKRNSLLEKRRA